MLDWEIIRTFVAIFLPTVALMAGTFWKVMAMIQRLETDGAAMIRRLENEHDESSKELHSRINRVREDMVHKSDIQKWQDVFTAELKDTRREVRAGITETNKRLDDILTMLAQPQSFHSRDK